MPAHPRDPKLLHEALRLVREAGNNIAKAARDAGISVPTLQHRYWDALAARDRGELPDTNSSPQQDMTDRIVSRLRRSTASTEDLQKFTGLGRQATLAVLEDIKASGYNIHLFSGQWSVEKAPQSKTVDNGKLPFTSDKNNKFVFGCISDNHLCSKYERLDVANDLYDRFVKAGIKRVYNAGNWIDGEAPFNKFDLKVHGLEPQLRYLAEHYPHRKGIETFAIAGEDHEGWLGRREAIDVGKFAESIMRNAGRMDWHHIGFIESYVPLVNANTGKKAQMLVMHPGGGSAYATSYRPQKIVESLEGGEKPGVLLIGHYHKLSVNLVRNVWVLQIGCTQDQTIFMRKKNIDAHIGGMIVELEQDSKTGAIIGCKTEIFRYFNQSYYNDRWSNSDSVVLPKRRLNGVRG